MQRVSVMATMRDRVGQAIYEEMFWLDFMMAKGLVEGEEAADFTVADFDTVPVWHGPLIEARGF